MRVDMNDIPQGDLYRINYLDDRGYEREDFVDRPDLVDKLTELGEKKLPINFIKIEE